MLSAPPVCDAAHQICGDTVAAAMETKCGGGEGREDSNVSVRVMNQGGDYSTRLGQLA